MRRFALLLVVCCLVTGTARFSLAPALAAPVAQDSAPGTLRVALAPPGSLDPVRLSRFDLGTRDLVENLFVGLTRYDPLTQTVEPMLATEWTVSPDGLTWTFTLREDVYWMQVAGEAVVPTRPVVAGDFVYSIQRACDPQRPSPVTPNLMIVQGCQTVAQVFPDAIDDLFLAREIGVRATGQYTLEIQLMYPAAYFPSLASTPEFRPVAREGVAQLESTVPSNAILTNGPYALQQWDTAGMMLVRNESWPEPFIGNVDRVEVVFTNAATTTIALVGGNRTDYGRLPGDEVPAARGAYPDLFQMGSGNTVVVAGFSYDRAVVIEPGARRALALAVDGSTLVESLLAGQALPIQQFTPTGTVAAPPTGSLAFDPGAAAASFSDAGFPGCNAVPETLILLVPDDDPLWTQIGEAITGQWSMWLGCNPALLEVRPISRVLLINLGHSAYDEEQVTRSHMWIATWSADYPDANGWLFDALHCQYGYLRPGRACDEADALLEQASVEMDPTRRAELYAEVETLFFGPEGSFPVIPLFATAAAWLQQPALSAVNAVGPARYDLWVITSGTE
ncbi:MAG: hypothetical protein GYB65_02050 [Chloroflexi bacterium]|nr:hypothetical protein [Chloroflexota bacterium]